MSMSLRQEQNKKMIAIKINVSFVLLICKETAPPSIQKKETTKPFALIFSPYPFTVSRVIMLTRVFM